MYFNSLYSQSRGTSLRFESKVRPMHRAHTTIEQLCREMLDFNYSANL